MRNISGAAKFYKQTRCGSTVSLSLYFYFSFIEKIILSSENRLLDNTFARSPERGAFFDPAAQLFALTLWSTNFCLRWMNLKFSTRGFLGSLMTNPRSKFKNSKWRIQYGGPRFKIPSIGMKFSTRTFFGSLIKNSSSAFKNSKWQIEYGGLKSKNLMDWDKIWYFSIFGVADYKLKNCNFAICFQDSKNSKMADPI